MKTVTIEIKNEIAMSFINNLESMNLLKIVDERKSPVKQKLSEKFAGCLSEERTDELQKELKQMRNEWERDAC